MPEDIKDSTNIRKNVANPNFKNSICDASIEWYLSVHKGIRKPLMIIQTKSHFSCCDTINCFRTLDRYLETNRFVASKRAAFIYLFHWNLKQYMSFYVIDLHCNITFIFWSVYCNTPPLCMTCLRKILHKKSPAALTVSLTQHRG